MPVTKEEVAQAMRDYMDAINGRYRSTAGENGLRAFETGCHGFGYRTAAARDFSDIREAAYATISDRWRGGLDRYQVELETFDTAVVGEVGLAFGWYVEEFQHKGQPPERARVRFSQSMVRDAEGWHVIHFHRDIQPFDENGQYPRSLTRVEGER